MRSNIYIKHSGHDNSLTIERELSRVFGTESKNISDLPLLTSRFKKTKDIAEKAFFVGRGLSGVTYAFFKIDRHVTQIYMECTSGLITLTEFKRVIANGISAITKSQLLPWVCEITDSEIYEDRDKEPLTIVFRADNWFTKTKQLLTKNNFSWLVTTYIIAAGIGFLVREDKSSIKFLVQESLFAPAALIFFGIIYTLQGITKIQSKVVVVDKDEC
jgi:hypothetical protein